MTTQTQTPVEQGTSRSRRRSWPLVAVAVLAAAVVGLGAGYLLFSPEPVDRVPPEVEAVLAEYWEAAAAGDAETILGMLTEDAHFFFLEPDSPQRSDSVLTSLISGWADVPLERYGTPIAIGGDGWYHVAALGIFGGEQSMGRFVPDEYLYILRLVEQDGELKIEYINQAGLL